jgi:hypothetical protein
MSIDNSLVRNIVKLEFDRLVNHDNLCEGMGADVFKATTGSVGVIAAIAASPIVAVSSVLYLLVKGWRTGYALGAKIADTKSEVIAKRLIAVTKQRDDLVLVNNTSPSPNLQQKIDKLTSVQQKYGFQLSEAIEREYKNGELELVAYNEIEKIASLAKTGKFTYIGS